MAITIDPDLEMRVRETVARTGAETAESFVQAAVERAILEALLVQSKDSGQPIEGTPEYWREKRQRLIETHEPSKRG
jgi:hypothetical protein